MSYYSPSIEKLIEAFEKLPSIGNKTAARLAFYMLDRTEEEVNEFVSAIVNAKKNLKYWMHEKLARKVFSLILPCFVLCHRAITPLCHSFRHMLCSFISAAPFTSNARQ